MSNGEQSDGEPSDGEPSDGDSELDQLLKAGAEGFLDSDEDTPPVVRPSKLKGRRREEPVEEEEEEMRLVSDADDGGVDAGDDDAALDDDLVEEYDDSNIAEYRLQLGDYKDVVRAPKAKNRGDLSALAALKVRARTAQSKLTSRPRRAEEHKSVFIGPVPAGGFPRLCLSHVQYEKLNALCDPYVLENAFYAPPLPLKWQRYARRKGSLLEIIFVICLLNHWEQRMGKRRMRCCLTNASGSNPCRKDGVKGLGAFSAAGASMTTT